MNYMAYKQQLHTVNWHIVFEKKNEGGKKTWHNIHTKKILLD